MDLSASRSCSGISQQMLASIPAMLQVFILDGDDVLLDLVLQQQVLHVLWQLIHGVDVGVDQLEALDLGPDESRVVPHTAWCGGRVFYYSPAGVGSATSGLTTKFCD